MRLIDANALREKVTQLDQWDWDPRVFLQLIDNAPTVKEDSDGVD